MLISDNGAAITGEASADVVFNLMPVLPSGAVVQGAVIGCSSGRPPHCPLPLGQVTRIELRFRARSLDQAITQAELVVEELPSAAAAATAPFAPAQMLLTVQRQITPTYDMVIPLAVGAVLAILTIGLILIQVRRIRLPRDVPPVTRVTRAVVRSVLPAADVKLTPVTVNAIRDWPILVSSVLVRDPAKVPDNVKTEADVNTAADVTAEADAITENVTVTELHQPVEIHPPAAAWDSTTKFRNERIFASASWSFKDSWATNITLVGGVAGAVLTATGAASTVFPGVQLDRFAIVMALFSFLVLLAPLVLAILLPRSDDADVVQATGMALLGAAAVTLIGVGGEIGTVGSLIWLSSLTTLERWLLLLLPVLGAAIVIWYACRTTVELVAHSRLTGRYSSGLSPGKDSSITL